MHEAEVEIFEVRTQQRVIAQLSGMTQAHLAAFEQDWKPLLLSSTEEDQYWEWRRKQQLYGTQLGAESYAIQYESKLQGLMLIQPLGYRSWVEPQRRLSMSIHLRQRPGTVPPSKNRQVIALSAAHCWNLLVTAVMN